MVKKSKINVKGKEISIRRTDVDDFISLTDIMRYKVELNAWIQ